MKRCDRGFALVLVLIIASVVILIVAAIMPQAVRQARMAERHADSIRAFYAAESGVNMVRADLDDDDAINSTSVGVWQALASSDGSETISYYKIDSIDTTSPYFPEVISAGSSPSSDSADVKRYIKAQLSKAITYNPSLVTNIIETTGSLSIGGSATVTGDYTSSSTFSFADIFGISMADMKSNLANVVIDPETNFSPVSGITWFELDDNIRVQISEKAWVGSGIMIVEGDLKLSGGTFDGIIWVTGNCDMDIAGNAKINGAIFVEGSANITGDAALSYDQDAVDDSLDDAFNLDPIAYWKEIYPSEVP